MIHPLSMMNSSVYGLKIHPLLMTNCCVDGLKMFDIVVTYTCTNGIVLDASSVIDQVSIENVHIFVLNMFTAVCFSVIPFHNSVL